MLVLTRRTPLALAATLALSALVSTGCVSTEKYNALRIERDGLNERLASAESEAREGRTQAAAWKSRLDQLDANAANGDGLRSNLLTQNESLRSQLADITKRYEEAMANIGKVGVQLSPELTNALTTFAEQNPTVVDFDPRTGIVKFKSDLTFASGADQLQPAAQQAIQSFAAILNSPDAKGYELMVCGHADNQPVSAPTVARGHKDNWYLSSHRALSVAEALKGKGVSPARIGAVGYGEFRPIASNDNSAGKQQNRRVEVLILPTQIAASTPPAAANTVDNAAIATPRPEVTVERREDPTK